MLAFLLNARYRNPVSSQVLGGCVSRGGSIFQWLALPFLGSALPPMDQPQGFHEFGGKCYMLLKGLESKFSPLAKTETIIGTTPTHICLPQVVEIWKWVVYFLVFGRSRSLFHLTPSKINTPGPRKEYPWILVLAGVWLPEKRRDVHATQIVRNSNSKTS